MNSKFIWLQNTWEKTGMFDMERDGRKKTKKEKKNLQKVDWVNFRKSFI